MAQYAIAFDLDTVRMRDGGITDSERTQIYQTEIPNALALCGFTVHIQGSVYRTDSEHEPMHVLIELQNNLRRLAPRFCVYLKRLHIFRVEAISEITDFISTAPNGDDAPPLA